MHKQLDALIFDLDGTLWDPCESVMHAENLAASWANVESQTSTELVRSTCGRAESEIWKIHFPNIRDEQIEIIRNHFAKAFAESLAHKKGAAFFPGVLEGLTLLKQQYRLFLVSNCSVDYLECFFKWSACRDLFEDTECFGRTGKPKGENIRDIITRNKINASVYIGDTAGDQKAAIEAGIPYYHAKYGFGRPEHECHEFENFSDLVRYFGTISSKSTKIHSEDLKSL